MVFWGPPSLLRLLISLHALVQWLGVFRSKPVSKAGIIIVWFRSSPELQAVTASHTPGDAASKESGESSDGHDGDSAASENPDDVSESSRRQGTSGVAPLTSPEDEASRSTLARRLEKELAQLRAQRRRFQDNRRHQRRRWSSEDSYVKYRLKEVITTLSRIMNAAVVDTVRVMRVFGPAALPTRHGTAQDECRFCFALEQSLNGSHG
ncbi:hypothetical protein TGGT1_410940 [Toxoplasma gondii GT1]|uniref:Transmembrane protein n=1 Tax=Toxoplasma gondii (strain ATCC 50853 / GT1) TaxID=507601 RepID=S7UFD7_TOXGG|nr:hypothetical protein TGGT1_410940 [Toxoplasma gondii GT1]